MPKATRVQVMMSDATQSRTLASLIGVALVLHLASAFGLERILRQYDPQPVNKLVKPTEVDLLQPPPPPEPTPPTPEPTPVEPVQPLPEPVHRVVENTPPPPPNTPPPAPEPTRAAPILTVPDEYSNEASDTMATGDNVNATGDVSNNGLVRGPGQGVAGARQGGVGNGTGHAPAVAGPPPAPPPPDLSVRAQIRCDEAALRHEFPDEASQAGITHMIVRVRMVVDADGRVSSITPLNDPGYGFAAAAVRAMRGDACSVTPARDRAGHAAPDSFPTFRVEFQLE